VSIRFKIEEKNLLMDRDSIPNQTGTINFVLYLFIFFVVLCCINFVGNAQHKSSTSVISLIKYR